MQYTTKELCNHLGDLVLAKNNVETNFESIDSTDEFGATSLIFLPGLPDDGYDKSVLPAVIVTNQKTAARLDIKDVSVIVVEDVRLALALSKQHFSDYDTFDSEWDSIHKTAVIHSSAQLGSGVRVGPNSIIGKGVQIGRGVHIRANCVIEHGAIIGADSVLHPMVNIGYNCVIGKRVIIRPGVIIGNEGFGFAQDKQKHFHRIPHTGTVHISDDVQIGSNSNIDRATYGVTHIARGVKIDALCHIAHNVTVDEDALFVAQCGVAGSSNIGKRVILSGQTGVLDHRTIVDDAVLVHRCGVTADVLEPGMWAGTPPKPFKEYVRDVNLAKKVERLATSVKKLKT